MMLTLIRGIGSGASLLWTLNGFKKGATDMGLIKRLKRITGARIDAFLDGIEDPKAVYPQLLRELEQYLTAARQAERKAENAAASAQRRMDEAEGKRVRYKRGAALALANGDEDTSREALRAEMEIEETLESIRHEHAAADVAWSDARALVTQLETELTRLREHKDEILERAQVAEVEEEINRAAEELRGESTRLVDVLSKAAGKVKDLARKVDQSVDAHQEEDLEQRLRRYEREAEVERRMSDIRRG